jgi:hypothetical protein
MTPNTIDLTPNLPAMFQHYHNPASLQAALRCIAAALPLEEARRLNNQFLWPLSMAAASATTAEELAALHATLALLNERLCQAVEVRQQLEDDQDSEDEVD